MNTINGKTTVQVITGTGRYRGRIDKQQISLPQEFANKTLTYIILTDTGVTGKQRSFIYGVTVTTTGNNANVPETSPLEQPSLDDVTQKMLDEAVSKLKGEEQNECRVSSQNI